MEIVIRPVADIASIGADIVSDAIEEAARRKKRCVLGLATGSRPVPLYAQLINRCQAGTVSFAGCTAFTLDGYLELPDGHDQSYRSVIQHSFADHVDLDIDRLHTPRSISDDPLAECASFDAKNAEAGGVDVQIVGLGGDGHFGFNEPGSSLSSRTRIKTLTSQTRADNSRFLASINEVPVHVITQGIGTILEARHIILIAMGSPKATVTASALEGPVTAMVPASAPQLHPHVTVLLDDAAAADLILATHHREVLAAKPHYQGF